MRDFTEWFEQSDYDMATAESMFATGRYVYAVFMAHLSLEKALKGVVQKQSGEMPPKTHDLLLLLKRSGLDPVEGTAKFLIRLNEAQIATRYPESLRAMLQLYPESVTRSILDKAKEAQQWIRQKS